MIESSAPVRYRSPDEDSGRWTNFPFRSGDIVISTRSKSGTTWMQMICALLVFQTLELPAPLPQLSPWLDHLIEPRDEVVARLQAQSHRRIIKTHTPLDGLPLDRRATFLVVARHPLDAALSLYHQGDNLDRTKIADLTGHDSERPSPRPDATTWLRSWIEVEADPTEKLDSLQGVFHHLGDAWDRRHEPNIELVHFDDLLVDLDGEMRRLGTRLELVDDSLNSSRWASLVDAARFEAMRARADRLAPDPVGLLVDRNRFFRGGRSGDAQPYLSPADLERYHRRVEALGPPDLLRWLHRSE